jgi:MFS transporter, Spinster family, sphingosine-1-phosphate transporter
VCLLHRGIPRLSDSAYRTYLLWLLVVVAAFNGVDRLTLGLVLQDIKVELGLTDTHLGFLTGLSFAFFYAVMGLPLARWADRGNRVTIISVGTVLWGGAVAVCAAVGGFVQLLMVRIAVAVGEASCNPAAYSLIADYFNRAQRPRAIAIFMLNVPLGILFGYFIAGWLNQLYGWRMTFLILGISGIVPALVAWLTLREPRKDRTIATSQAVVGWGEVLQTLWRSRTYRHMLFAFAVGYFFAQGISTWMSAFFIRSHGLKTGELGTWLGLIYGACGFVGAYLGGELATRFAANNERAQLWAAGAVYASFSLLNAIVFVAADRHYAFGALAVIAFINAATYGPLFATIQTLVPENMRATSIAVTYLFNNLIGMGLGPLAAGAMSDFFRPWAGEESLRFTLLALSCGYVWAGWHFWSASRTVAEDLAVVERQP